MLNWISQSTLRGKVELKVNIMVDKNPIYVSVKHLELNQFSDG